MVILEAEETNNCEAARKFNVTENNVRRWRQQKNDFLNSSNTRKAFRGPKRGRFGEIEIEVAKYVADMRREGFPVTMESIQVKGREIARNLYISEFKASMSWCKRMVRRRKWLVLLLHSLIFFSKCPIRLIIRSCLRSCLYRISIMPTHYYRH
jgi:transposase-like protein